MKKDLKASYRTTDPNLHNTYDPVIRDKSFEECDKNPKAFKFRNKSHVMDVQNEYMPLKLRKFENDLHPKSNCFEYPVAKDLDTTNESFSNFCPGHAGEDKILQEEIDVSSLVFNINRMQLRRKNQQMIAQIKLTCSMGCLLNRVRTRIF
jgi:hypothetical protein